jgi:hypothetical protein
MTFTKNPTNFSGGSIKLGNVIDVNQYTNYMIMHIFVVN